MENNKDRKQDLSDLKEKRKDIETKILTKKRWAIGFIVVALLLIFSAISGLNEIEKINGILKTDTYMIVLFLVIGGEVMVAYGSISLLYTIPVLKEKCKHIINDIYAIQEELEIREISETQYEKRAEIQFKNHQKELRRYYDINLGQLKLVFPIGIATMFVGIVIIGLTLFFFGNNAKENIAPVLAGTISGILIDFVGAVFIRMYMETIKASTEFHNKLIHSNDNLFANVLATKITDENLKNETFSEMAKIISMGKTEAQESKDNN